jgi:hypothetical protein
VQKPIIQNLTDNKLMTYFLLKSCEGTPNIVEFDYLGNVVLPVNEYSRPPIIETKKSIGYKITLTTHKEGSYRNLIRNLLQQARPVSH